MRTFLKIVTLLMTGLIAPLGAQVRTAPPLPVCERSIACTPQVPDAQRVSSHVTASLDGRIVRYEVEDRYVNHGGRPAEVDYLLPLPKGAAFENLELSINGEMVAGETMRADRARGVYEEIVRKMRDPALVEWMDHDLLRTRIFPINPGEEKRVVVRFSAVAQREGSALRLDWPARAGGSARGESWFELTYPRPSGSSPFGQAYSPTHTTTVLRPDEDVRRVSISGDPSRAMTVLVPIKQRAAAALALLPYVAAGEDPYVLITLSPPAPSVLGTGRDVTFVVDVSGSRSEEHTSELQSQR